MELIDEIITKLRLSADKQSLYKTFEFTRENLQDNPDCLLKILSYLEMHRGKYEDFAFHSWVDSNTFTPKLMIQLTPNEEYRKHIISEAREFANYFEDHKNKENKNEGRNS